MFQESAGRTEEAQAKRGSARAMVQEISGIFTDEELRSTYLQSALPKVGG